jgi:hypothetical protein
MRLRKGQRGSAMVEFALVGVPLLFAWISAVEMARGVCSSDSATPPIEVLVVRKSRRRAKDMDYPNHIRVNPSTSANRPRSSQII